MQVGATGGQAGCIQARAAAGAGGEAEPRQVREPVAAVGRDLGDETVHPDALVRERAAGLGAGGRDQRAEGVGRRYGRPQRERIAEVAERALRPGGAVDHRGGDQEVTGRGVAVHERVERGEQRHERRGALGAGEFADLVEQARGQLRGRMPGGWVRQRGDAVLARQLQRLRRLGQLPAPVGDVVGVGGRGLRPVEHGQVEVLRHAVAGGGQIVGVRGGEVGEERVPAVVVPRDVMHDEDQDMARRAGADEGAAQRQVDVEVERAGELTAGEHLEPAGAGG